ncbi:MAG: DNA helicase RecQ [Phycisphaerales bacterium]|nr:MAG: DNA helicase RecQ [Phycisphaerales bacterium]
METVRIGQSVSRDRMLSFVEQYWGFDRFRPLQEEAIRAVLSHQDSVVVLPTGGGKSLCYQVPPVLAERTDVVVSPLISLMKDQVDGLQACGYPAVALHTGMTSAERDEAGRGILAGKYRLVFVSPERILTPGFMNIIQQVDVRAFAIDEAHCISHWGHDFRPEYRRLATLKERFPSASVHAYTATATERVRGDIAEQLDLNDPEMLVGDFDRSNLVYRVIPRVDVHGQVADVIRRHEREGVIVYCLSRKDTESMAQALREAGIVAEPYHAGLDTEQRRRTQDAFAEESLDVVAATVAFGMGIDRSNVRCVVHATMPKSVEHYQQETGRAGRDGLEAECVLLYSAADVMRWESLVRRSTEESADPEELLKAAMHLLEQMRLFCTRVQCRHRALAEYFGQTYLTDNCAACDVCLDEVEGVEDATVTAQKIISCVARINRGSDFGFGVGHAVDVVTGANTEQIRRHSHDGLSTYGLLSDMPRKTVTNLVYQLIDLGLLERSADDRPVLGLNDSSWEVMRGNRQVKLFKPKAKPVAKTRAAIESWEGVDRSLFEHLRGVRLELARERGAPAFVIFSDATLRDMARERPTTLEVFRRVHGVGDAKLSRFGKRFVSEIKHYCDKDEGGR